MKRIALVLLLLLIPFNILAIVSGDVDGNSKVNSADYLKVKKHILGLNKLSGAELTRADVNSDGKVSAADYLAIKKIILGIDTSSKIHFIKQPSSNKSEKELTAGDAILLESNGHYAMIDTGLDNAIDNKYILDYLKKVGVKSLDFVLITHSHKDHIGGLPYLIKNLKISSIYLKKEIGNGSGTVGKNLYNETISLAKNKNIKVVYVDSVYKDGNGFNFQDMKIELYNTKQNINKTVHYNKSGEVVYNTVNANSNSILELIKVNGYKILLTGDLYDEKDNISYFLNLSKKSEFKNLDLLKIPHHGYVRSAFGGTKDGTYNVAAFKNFNPKNIVVTHSKCDICNSIGAKKNVYYSKKKTAVVFSFDSKIGVQYVS